ncbi:MAG: pentapeptide repeat-containing protein [Myxococcales bacterium]|nr:pentapeptide repeat-containing protein [Myxococcales bacterium]
MSPRALLSGVVLLVSASLGCGGCSGDDDNPESSIEVAPARTGSEGRPPVPREAGEVEAWNRSRVGEVRRASLRGLDRAGARLDGIDLSGLDLRQAKLRDAVLIEARLGGTRLDKADLQGVDLSRARLEEAILDHAQTRSIVLHDAQARGLHMRWVDLDGADLRGADLREADLRGSSFVGAELAGAKLGKADLRGTDLRGVDLSAVVIEGASELDLRGSKADAATRWPAAITEPLIHGVTVDGVTAKDLAIEQEFSGSAGVNGSR